MVGFPKSGHIISYVTGFVKRGPIRASDFATLMSHNFDCRHACIYYAGIILGIMGWKKN